MTKQTKITKQTKDDARSVFARFVIFVCFVFSSSQFALAQSGRKPQQQPGQPPAEKPVARIETREVVLPLIAYDADGKYVDDLTEKDVLVLEEGEARPVTKLRREPANIVLLLDLSNEIGTFKNGPTDRVEQEKRPVWALGKDYQVMPRPTAREFADKFVSGLSPNDQIAIIQYADRVQLIQDWTGDREKALESLRSKYRVGIKSSYLDALKLAADKLQSRERGRRVIVMVSDGLDSNSKATRSKAMEALEKSRAAVFVVGWADALAREIEIAAHWADNRDRQTTSTAARVAELRRHIPKLEAAAAELRGLAESSGGEMWLPPTHLQLINIHWKLAREIGAQYSLSFVTERKPSLPDLEDTRAIQVLPARAGLTLRSRRSYYAGDE
ncbi:MAG: VWA domain-containing protein [Blastocatellia bacterium]